LPPADESIESASPAGCLLFVSHPRCMVYGVESCLAKGYICIAGVCVGYIRLPQSQKQCAYLSKAYCYFLWGKKFLAVRRVGLMTRHEYRIERPFPVT
jgi:hypothetical protein